MSPRPGLEPEPQPEPETELETPENRKRQPVKYLGPGRKPAQAASTWSSARNGGLPDLASAPDQPLKR